MLDKKTNKKLNQVSIPNRVERGSFRRQPIVSSRRAQNQPPPSYYVWTVCDFENPFQESAQILFPDNPQQAGSNGWGPPVGVNSWVANDGSPVNLGTMWLPGQQYTLCASNYVGNGGDPSVVGWAACSQALWESLGEPEPGDVVGWLATNMSLNSVIGGVGDVNPDYADLYGASIYGGVESQYPYASCLRFVGKFAEYELIGIEGLDLNPPNMPAYIEDEPQPNLQMYLDGGFVGDYGILSQTGEFGVGLQTELGVPVYPGTCFAPMVTNCEDCSTSQSTFLQNNLNSEQGWSPYNSAYFYWFGCMHPGALNYNPEAICPLPLNYCDFDDDYNPDVNRNEQYHLWEPCGNSDSVGYEWEGAPNYFTQAPSQNSNTFYQIMGSPEIGQIISYGNPSDPNPWWCLKYMGYSNTFGVQPTTNTLPLNPPVALLETYPDCVTCQFPDPDLPQCDCPDTITYNIDTINSVTINTNFTGFYDPTVEYNAGDAFVLDWYNDGLGLLTSHPNPEFVALIDAQGLSNPVTQFELPQYVGGQWIAGGPQMTVSVSPPCAIEPGPKCYIYMGTNTGQVMATSLHGTPSVTSDYQINIILPLSLGPSMDNGGQPYWAGAYVPLFGWQLDPNTQVLQQQGLLPLNRNFVCCSYLVPDCVDPAALNYNPNALVGCPDNNGDGLPDCCLYYTPPTIMEEKKCLPALTKEEFLMNVCQKPETRSDVFIERGKVSVFERCQRLSVNPTIGELELHGYGYYKFENQS